MLRFALGYKEDDELTYIRVQVSAFKQTKHISVRLNWKRTGLTPFELHAVPPRGKQPSHHCRERTQCREGMYDTWRVNAGGRLVRGRYAVATVTHALAHTCLQV